MKKKAEAEARESLQSAAEPSPGDSVSSSASVPDDAKELIAAMQNQSGACAAEADPSQKSLKSDASQKSRARRLTSTTVAVDDAPQMQSGGVRESSGEECGGWRRGWAALGVCAFAESSADILNIDDAPQSDQKVPEKKGFFSRAKGWFSGSKANEDKEDVAPEANGKKKRGAKAAPPAEAEETRVTRARVKAGDM